MPRLGLPGLAVLTSLALGLTLAPATAATTAHVTGTVTVAGVPVEGAQVTLEGTSVVTDALGRWSADLLPGSTDLVLEVSTPHEQHSTDATYLGTVDVTDGLDVPLTLPGDRATTITVTEADGTTPVAHAEWDLFPPPGVKLVPSLGVLHTMSSLARGADQALTDETGTATFYVPDLVTSDAQTATVEVWDPLYTRPGISQPVAFPRTPAAVDLRFPAASVPSAPRSLAVEVVAEDSVALTWSPPQTDGGSYVEDYVVTYGGTGEATSTRVVDPAATGPERVRLTGLTPGKQYDVAVVARNQVGSSPSATLRVTTMRASTQVRLDGWSPLSPVSGQPVALAGAVTSTYPVRGGTVTVHDNGVAIGQAAVGTDGRFTLTRPFLAGGHAIAIAYSGDASHLPATPSSPTPAPPIFTVGKASSRLTVTSAVSGKGNTRDVRLDVAALALAPGAGTPSGTVTVRDSLSGTTRTLSLSGGTVSTSYARLRTKQTVTFTVSYAGSAEFAGATASMSVKL